MTSQSEQMRAHIEEQEKSIVDLQQMLELSQRKLLENQKFAALQVKQQKEENTKLKQMYSKIQAGQEDEFNAILAEAAQPLEGERDALAEKKAALQKEVDELKASLGNPDGLKRVEEEHQQVKQQLENEIKAVQAKLNTQNAAVQKQQQELDALVGETEQIDAEIQHLHDQLIKCDVETKKVKARLEGRSVDTYA